MSKEIKVNRRRVLGGIATVGVASAALGAGTFAVFSDEQTSDENSISAGTLTLDVSGGNSTPASGSSSFGYTFNNIVPGEVLTVTATIEITGTVDTGNITVETTTSEENPPLAEALEIDHIHWPAGTNNGVNTGYETLADLTEVDPQLEPGPAESGGAVLEIQATFAEDDSNIEGVSDINDLQGESLDIDHTFSVEQST